MQALEDIKEVQRRESPGKRPQPLAFHNGLLWVGSWETDKLYGMDPQSWAVVNEVAAPGRPYGIAPFDGSLYVVVALGEDDDRYLFRFRPEVGFDNKLPCPDLTGSHLAADDRDLYLCQQGLRRILVIDTNVTVKREIALPTRIGGFNLGPGAQGFILSGDEEWENLKLAQIDLRQSAPPVGDVVAAVPFEARGLAYDGSAWWTCEREASEIVSFTT